MMSGSQAVLQRQQSRLQLWHKVIAMVQVRLEGQLAHVQQGGFCACLLGAAGILAGQGMAKTVGFGIAVENKQVGGHGMAP